MGGIQCAEDVLEFLYAGASSVAIGTANFVDPFICQKIISDLEKLLEEQKINHITDVIGRSWKECKIQS